MSKEQIIQKMNDRGWIYDIESKAGAILFFSQSCVKIAMRFRFWRDAEKYLKK